MKRYLPFVLILLTLSMSAQRKPKIKGNRVVTQVNEALPEFNAVVLEDDLDIVLKKSFGPGYVIEADDNLIDILKFKVEDSTLIISSFYNVTTKKKFDITVNFVELKAITVKEGSVLCDDIIANEIFFADVFADSKLDIKVDAGVMDLNLEESGSGDFNLDVDSLNVAMRGRTDALIYSVSGTKNIKLDDNASLTLEGTTDLLMASLTSNSKLKAQKLEAAEIDLRLQESSNATVNSYREIKLATSGNSKTFLYGNPKIVVEEFLDTSQLIKRKTN
ncbi:MAG: DUF2807 domain-containing protein [Allomuricauda sp.]|nr:MAG: DUF2807 domain-containing protein [Allomuricauda sp.]